MNKFAIELKKYLLENGASDVGFSRVDDGFGKLSNAITVVVRLSDAIIDEIENAPTHTYFNHYRTVNAFIDSLLLKVGLFLQNKGSHYITVAASQSINDNGSEFSGRYSHKKAACFAGLGVIGKSALFIHHTFGTRVRLGTIFTDYDFETENAAPQNICNACDKCVKACPAMAISGKAWDSENPNKPIIDASACSKYMKTAFQHIGRGAVCGICIKVCNQRQNDEK